MLHRYEASRALKCLAALLAAGILVSCSSDSPSDERLVFSQHPSDVLLSDTSSSPSASWIDFDQDGDDDLYVLNGYGSLEENPSPQQNKLYRNDGNGGFTLVRDHPLVNDRTFSGSSTWGDYDNDGDSDVFVANQRGADNFLFRNDGNGSFVRTREGAIVNDGGRSFSAVWVDVDGDGLLDLHVLNGRDGEGGQVDFVYRNRGGGQFARVDTLGFAADSLPSGGAAWADFDSDGDVDLFLPVYAGTPNRLYRNDGDWAFTEIAQEAGLTTDPLPFSPRTSVAHWVDFDGDLDLDLFVGNTGGTVDFLFENDGSGHFDKVAAGRIGLDATYVTDGIWGDFDNDADQDFLLAVWGGASELFENDGAGRFYPRSAEAASSTGDFGHSIAFVSSASANDFDGDGDLDAYLTQWPINPAGGAPNLFFVNETNTGNWLEVNLEGTDSNRSAIGAQVVVTTTIDGARHRQLRSVSARTSWRSTSSLTQHFGLADAPAVETIEVRWPSGHVDTVDGPVDANQRVTIEEESGIVRGGVSRPELSISDGSENAVDIRLGDALRISLVPATGAQR